MNGWCATRSSSTWPSWPGRAGGPRRVSWRRPHDIRMGNPVERTDRGPGPLRAARSAAAAAAPALAAGPARRRIAVLWPPPLGPRRLPRRGHGEGPAPRADERGGARRGLGARGSLRQPVPALVRLVGLRRRLPRGRPLRLLAGHVVPAPAARSGLRGRARARGPAPPADAPPPGAPELAGGVGSGPRGPSPGLAGPRASGGGASRARARGPGGAGRTRPAGGSPGAADQGAGRLPDAGLHASRRGGAGGTLRGRLPRPASGRPPRGAPHRGLLLRAPRPRRA